MKGNGLKKEDMEYLERINISNGSQEIFAYSNGKTMMWYRELNNPKDAGSGRIIAGQDLQVFSNFYAPAEFTFGYMSPLKWPAVLRNGTAKIVGTEEIDGHLCYIVSGEFVPGKLTQYKVWIDTERGFQPLKLQRILPDRGVRAWYDFTELRRFSGNTWLPVEMTFHGQNEYKEVNTSLDVKINQGIPDSQFIIEWTKGTKIWDAVRNRSFTIGEDITAKELLKELQIIPDEEEPEEAEE